MTDGYYYCLNCHSEITPDYNEHCCFCGMCAIAVPGDYTNEEAERAFDLLNKEQQGLIIVPPCKVGDTVYVDGDTWSGYACIHYENEFIHSKFFVIGEIVSFIKTKKQLLMKIRVDSANHSRYYHKRYTVSAIGKTVFLTKEQAEKELKERTENE